MVWRSFRSLLLQGGAGRGAGHPQPPLPDGQGLLQPAGAHVNFSFGEQTRQPLDFSTGNRGMASALTCKVADQQLPLAPCSLALGPLVIRVLPTTEKQMKCSH